MKKEIAELVGQKKWEEASEYIKNRRNDFSAEELIELEKMYMDSIGVQSLDEKELKKISGGSAVNMENGSVFITGNIHYWCKTTSKRDDCHDSVLQTSWCWYNDACTLIYHQYNDMAGWHGDLESDY